MNTSTQYWANGEHRLVRMQAGAPQGPENNFDKLTEELRQNEGQEALFNSPDDVKKRAGEAVNKTQKQAGAERGKLDKADKIANAEGSQKLSPEQMKAEKELQFRNENIDKLSHRLQDVRKQYQALVRSGQIRTPQGMKLARGLQAEGKSVYQELNRNFFFQQKLVMSQLDSGTRNRLGNLGLLDRGSMNQIVVMMGRVAPEHRPHVASAMLRFNDELQPALLKSATPEQMAKLQQADPTGPESISEFFTPQQREMMNKFREGFSTEERAAIEALGKTFVNSEQQRKGVKAAIDGRLTNQPGQQQERGAGGPQEGNDRFAQALEQFIRMLIMFLQKAGLDKTKKDPAVGEVDAALEDMGGESQENLSTLRKETQEQLKGTEKDIKANEKSIGDTRAAIQMLENGIEGGELTGDDLTDAQKQLKENQQRLKKLEKRKKELQSRRGKLRGQVSEINKRIKQAQVAAKKQEQADAAEDQRQEVHEANEDGEAASGEAEVKLSPPPSQAAAKARAAKAEVDDEQADEDEAESAEESEAEEDAEEAENDGGESEEEEGTEEPENTEEDAKQVQNKKLEGQAKAKNAEASDKQAARPPLSAE